MEPTFELIVRPTRDDYLFLYKIARPKNHKIWLILYGIMLLLCILLSWYLESGIILLYGLICGGYGVWLYFWPGRASKKRYERMLREYAGRIPSTHVCFGEAIVVSEEEDRTTIRYEKINMIILSEERMVIRRNNEGGWLLIKLSDFVRGDSRGLCRFLREKCPGAKLVGFSDL